ncbi:hypothetical protein PILCRDRAFT_818140 [Piloderma croceum F 1598]|uniref:Copper transport protein n=1 Tax=Piloderma croceum (strain F 1598) TaxID=765440 RepID=A0A0C3FJD9_PILCF|nr:hypothetical protein PILCRDRAFT_818140 [Piloderma croceum F 1598]
MRGSLEARWRKQTLAMISGRYGHISHTSDETKKIPEVVTEIQTVSRTNSSSSTGARKLPRKIAPFIAAHDIPRGAIHAFQALLGYTLMLAIMTFQAAYIISIIIGLGLGEVLFGRMGGTSAH